MSALRTVLLVGLNPAKRGTEETKNAGLPIEVQQVISKQISDAKDAGYLLQVELITADEMEEKVPQIRSLLQAQDWDGYIVAGGIRKEFSLTKYFELLVNFGRVLRPQARMGFNTSATDIMITIDRMFQE